MTPVGGLPDATTASSAAAWLRPPKGLLARVRWCFLLTAYFNGATAMLMMFASDAPLPLRFVGFAAAVFMCRRWTRGYQRGGFEARGDFLSGLALILVGFGAGDPIRSAIVLYTGLFLQAMFGTRRRIALATAVHMVAFVIAVCLSPTRELLTVWSPEVLLQPPGVLMILVMYVLGDTLARHERAAARERALARVGSDLVASKDRDSVYAAALRCVRAIVSPHAYAEALLAFGDEERMTVIGTTCGGRLRGMTIGLASVPSLQERMLRCQPYELDANEIAIASKSLGVPSRPTTAFTTPLVSGDKLCGVLSVVTQSSLPDECKDGIVALAMEVALALENLALREQLAHQAFHDPLTNLANRALLAPKGWWSDSKSYVPSAFTSRSMTLVLAIHRWPTCAICHLIASRQTSRSCVGWKTARPRRRSFVPS